MDECRFCSEVIKTHSFFETPNELVVYNTVPILPGHTLVIPKKHRENIHDLSPDEITSLFSTVNLVAQKLKEKYKAEGMNYAWNENLIAGQTIPHLHIHILPRHKDDMNPDPRNLYYRTEQNRKPLSTSELEETLEDLRKLFN